MGGAGARRHAAAVPARKMTNRPTSSSRSILRPGNIVFDTLDPERLCEFWAAVTGYVKRELFEPYLGLHDPLGIGANLTFQRISKAEDLAPRSRCHLDIYVDDPHQVAVHAETLGARIVRRVDEGDVYWVVLCDPDGNEFCLVAAVGPDRAGR